jgi:preprotein translocase subunit SecY
LYNKITINIRNISSEMKKSKGFIPGIKPGKDTSEFIKKILNRYRINKSS